MKVWLQSIEHGRRGKEVAAREGLLVKFAGAGETYVIVKVRADGTIDLAPPSKMSQVTKSWPAEDLVVIEHPLALMRSSKKSKRVSGYDDPDYVVQGIWGDRVVDSFGYDGDEAAKRDAVRAAKDLLEDPLFEGDSARVITRDGELVWSSRGQGEIRVSARRSRSGFMHQKPPTGFPKQIGSHRFSIVFYTREYGKSGGDAYAEEHADDFDQARRRGYLKLAAHPGLGTFHVYDWKYPQHAREGLPWIGRQHDLEKHTIDQLLTMPRKHGNMKLGR